MLDPWAKLATVPRYRGPWLTADQRAELARDDDPEARRALLWDAYIRQFAADRPLPADFARRPSREQVTLLAWSFHVELGPDTSEREAIRRLAEALDFDLATRPSPLASEYPALDDYARFLAGLPRRLVEADVAE